MKILWFPRIQPDIGKLHLATWREMCRELESLGCTVKIAVTGRDEDNILDRDVINIPVIRKKFLRILSFWVVGYLKFMFYMVTFKPDLVMLDISSIWFSLPFALFKKRKCIFIIDERTPRYSEVLDRNSLQDKVMRRYTRVCYWYADRFLDGITVITSYFKNFVNKKYGYPLSKLAVWGSGVDVKQFTPDKCDRSKMPGFMKDKFIVMQHGEFSFNRGILETIEAISLLDQDDICMMLIGSGIAGQAIAEKIKEMGLGERVHVLPPVSHKDVINYIGYCDCSVMAYPNIEYWNNNNPIKLLEYFAMGKVLICTDMWTFRDVAGDRECAHYINDNAPEKIAKAINYCYENRGFLIEWGKTGIDIVRERFTWNQHARTLLDFTNQLSKRDSV